MKNKKLVIFDFADTIAELSPSKEELLQKFVFDELGKMIDIQKIKEVYHYTTNLIFYSSVSIKTCMSKKEFYIKFNNNILSLLGLVNKISSEKLFNYFNDNGQHWVLKEGVTNLLRELKSKKYLLSLVSNFDTRLTVILKNMGITQYFDSIYISQTVGLEKPNIDFFKLPLKEHNILPKNSFFIGDSYILDFLPSQSIKINSILLDELDRYPLIDKLNKIDNIVNCTNIIYKV